MKILYVGSDQERFMQIQLAWGRSTSNLLHESTPESAAFLLLNDNVQALILDLSDKSVKWREWLPNLTSLNPDVEWAVIATHSELEIMDHENMRGCFGVLVPPVYGMQSMLTLAQLNQKLDLMRKLKSMEDASVTDGLTKLYNHAYVQKKLAEEVANAKKFDDTVSVIFLDVDHFKKYNDQNGHPEGDKVLIKVAEILGKSVRRFDMAGRYGGEEFVLVLPNAPLKIALKVAERIRRHIMEADFEHAKKQPMGFVSVSIGVSYLKYDVKTREDLLHLADQALYKAKENGRNQVWYYRKGDYKPLKISK